MPPVLHTLSMHYKGFPHGKMSVIFDCGFPNAVKLKSNPQLVSLYQQLLMLMSKNWDSDLMLAVSQKMFEIEQFVKGSIPSNTSGLYNLSNHYLDPEPVYGADGTISFVPSNK